MDLPEECWQSIFNFVDHRHRFSSLSLVCKQFLSITNDLVTALAVLDPTLPLLPDLVRRFPKLRKIDLSGLRGDIDGILSQLAETDLALEEIDVSNRRSVSIRRNLPIHGLRSVGRPKVSRLRRLNCSKIGSLRDSDLNLIVESFPFLEDLDISFPELGFSNSGGVWTPITDAGILSLSLKLKGLRKINLSGNHFITDRSLAYLSANCLLLNEIVIHCCDFITQNGIALLFRRCANLNSVSVFRIRFSLDDSTFNYSLLCAKALRAVDFTESVISDELLYSIGEASLPLNKLILANSCGFTYNGISFLLSKHRSIQHLDLQEVNFLTDEYMITLSEFLHSVTYINLSMCYKLTDSTFFCLTRNCPFLNEIKMAGTNLGAEDSTFSAGSVANTRVKSLNLAQNRSLGNESIKTFASLCPDLQMLDLSNCVGITEEGVLEVLRRCPEIRHLGMNQCIGIENFLVDFELSNLEVLCAWGSGIDDYGLALIGKRCPQLLQLDLTGCLAVTAKGVKEVVQSCRALREINLKWCNNVSVDIVALMVFTRPSLRKIVPPCGFVPSESQRNLYLRHGCLICER
ncbi:F-box/LRR-repeat protein 2 [Morus notabilis]|uniref:F-box/LRR-repeat protein 2 n=1 Tax=Morus notabilis TaxID=981085 RepID=UPI000CED6F3C|nr:F-box/LRR-repeat protein 2 [Morus notabilis]